METYLGEIRLFGGTFAPAGWALCNGQLLPIAQNQALFSLLGTTYGGDGRTTFALPNLQGRAPMHWGAGPGLTPRVIGESAGSETVTVEENQMAAHSHHLLAAPTAGKQSDPLGHVLADAQSYAAGPYDQAMAPAGLGSTGGGQPHNNMQPYLAVTFIIALQGIFPPRG